MNANIYLWYIYSTQFLTFHHYLVEQVFDKSEFCKLSFSIEISQFNIYIFFSDDNIISKEYSGNYVWQLTITSSSFSFIIDDVWVTFYFRRNIFVLFCFFLLLLFHRIMYLFILWIFLNCCKEKYLGTDLFSLSLNKVN